ncbi:MAG: hypothetical protein K5920_05070 [Bacteroidales bacterium]|nr:hypothetical protein [Bacteroidales bacterium]
MNTKQVKQDIKVKKTTLIVLFFWLSNYSVNAQINDTITFSINDILIDTLGNFIKVEIPDCSFTDIVGCPELPRLEVRYVIPSNKIVSDVIVSDSVVQLFHNDFLILPHQPSTIVGDTSTFFVQPDSAVYRSDFPYPRKMVELVDNYIEFGYHIVLLYIYPFVYYPQQKILRFNSSISFSFSFSNNEMVIQQPKKESERMFELCKTLLKSEIRNNNLLDGNIDYSTEIISINESYYASNKLLFNELGVFPEYIIITNNSDVNGNELESFDNQTMSDIFQCYANWKTKKGVPSVVVTIDDINNNYLGNDIQAKIHNFLVDLYEDFGSMFILFGGDINIVPERVIKMDKLMYGGIIHHLTFATDSYYSAIESSWDFNGNGEYGETVPINYSNWYNVDQSDNTAEFFLARIPVSTCALASSFINKTLSYESLSGINPIDRKYTNNIVALMAFLEKKDNPENAALNSYMSYTNSIFGITEPVVNGINQESIKKWRGFESKKNLDSSVLAYWMPISKNNAFSCFNSIIPISIAEKAHVVLHCDHSSYLSLGTGAKNKGEKLNREDVDLLRNYPFNKILISYGCSPGDFRKDCIIEHFLNNSAGGGVSAIASSTTSYTDEFYRIQPLLKSLYQWKLGNIIHQPILYNIALIQHRSSILGQGMLNFRKNHLFGDPELPIWTREPVDLTVSVTPSTITNIDNELTVSVRGMAYSEYATNDVMVCVMKDNEVYLREHYDGTAHNHDFVFNVNPETAGELSVTVTGHNYIPYETTVPVTIAGKNYYIAEKTVADASGNNDGRLDAGESDYIRIALTNNGTASLADVTATLSCEFTDESLNQNIDDYLTLVTPTAYYGTIAPGDTVTRSNFQLDLSNTIPDRSSLYFTLTLGNSTGEIGTRSFSLPIGAPEIEYVSVAHEIKPNGRVGLNIALTNMGFGSAKGVTASLSSTSDLQITLRTALYGTMGHLEAKTESFEFIPLMGSIASIPFTLTVEDSYGKSWTFNFTLRDIPDTVENLAFESTEHSIKLKWDPVDGCRGYYVYRYNTASGNYERLNNYPIPSSAYPDLGLQSKQVYYYGVSFLDEDGNESMKATITTWTTLPIAEGWPIAISDDLGRVWNAAPNVADTDNDGRKEIFLTTGDAETHSSIGSVLGFSSNGEELYDIDHNPTTISGFANIGINMTCTPAIGDIDNDGVMEIVVATRDAMDEDNHFLYVYKNDDFNEDGAPDLAWRRTLDFKNFNGVVLADLDDNGTLEIIAPNQGNDSGRTRVEVFDCFGDTVRNISIPYNYNVDRKAVTMPVIADFDNDGHKEIVFGLEGGVYSWSYPAGPLDTLVSYNSDNVERTDCPVIAADIDGDGDLEVLYMAIKNGRGYIRAVSPNGNPVSGWSGETHYVSLSNTNMDWAWPPYFSVADIDNDGDIEVFAADKDTLKMWKDDGTAFDVGQIHIPNLDCRYFQPIIADVDGHEDCEIIVPSQNGYIHAYKTNGYAVPGWPLSVDGLSTIPVVTDIDGDGYNEVVAAAEKELYVWHTEGESRYNHCDRFRYNPYNNAVYEIPCSHSQVPIEISGYQTWSVDRRIGRDVIVEGGAVLTITSELQFSEDSRIIVKPGGRLILDGGVLTNACPGEMWPGIEIWGNSTQNQYPDHGNYMQGYIELKNGAVIENAVCALELWRPDHAGTTGGVVFADSAVFRNNALAVHVLNYSNHNPISGAEVSYAASFQNCSFVIDDAFFGTEKFQKHVSLDHVNGITFEGCAFSVDPDASNVSLLCCGIDAYDAGFSVLAWCSRDGVGNQFDECPDEYMVPSSFTRFHDAIHTVSDGNDARSFRVTGSEFYYNTHGIYAQNTGYGTILNNEFLVGSVEDCSYGICIKSVEGFCIEENVFVGAEKKSVNFGVGVFDCGSNNDVFLNTFNGLNCGNVAVGNNMAIMPEPPIDLIMVGLTYSCNQNANNAIDFYVTSGENNGGIKQNQGSTITPAGNTFSGFDYHFYNDGAQYVNYYFNSNEIDETPDPTKLYRVNRISTTSSNSCETHYGSIIKSPSEKKVLEAEYLSAHESYLKLIELYGNLVNNTSITASAQAALAAEIGELAHDFNLAAGDIVRSNLNESLANPQELRFWLGNMGDIASDRMAVASYMQEGDYESALELAASFPALYGLTGSQLQEHSDYMRLVSFYRTLYTSGRTIKQMTDKERRMVDSIADVGIGFSKSMAEVICEGSDGQLREGYDCPILPVATRTRGNASVIETEGEDFTVSVIPNPTNDFVNLNYTLPEGMSEANLEITNVLGLKVFSVTLEGRCGSKEIHLGNLSAGIYNYTAQCGNRVLYGKLIITQ